MSTTNTTFTNHVCEMPEEHPVTSVSPDLLTFGVPAGYETSTIINAIALSTIILVGCATVAFSAALLVGAMPFIALPIALQIGALAASLAITAIASTSLGLFIHSNRLMDETVEALTDNNSTLATRLSESSIQTRRFARGLDELSSQHTDLEQVIERLVNSENESDRRSEQQAIVNEARRFQSNTVIVAQNRAIEAYSQELQRQLDLVLQAGSLEETPRPAENLARLQEMLPQPLSLDMRAGTDATPSAEDHHDAQAALLEELSRSTLFSSHIGASSSDDWSRSVIGSSTFNEVSVPLDVQEKVGAFANYLYGYLPSMELVGNTLTTGAGLVFSQAAAAGVALREFVANNMVEYNHPWKQKKYEIASKELFRSFVSADIENIALLEQSEIGRMTSTLLASIFNIAQNNDESFDFRAAYYEIIISLRAIINTSDYQRLSSANESPLNRHEAIVVEVIRHLCRARYHDVQMYAFAEQLVRDVITEGGSTERANDPQLRPEDFDAIDAAPREWKGTEIGKSVGKLKGFTNINFDPALYCNVPFVIGDLPLRIGGRDKSVRLLRMGVPTIQKPDLNSGITLVKTVVDPIWLQYIAQVETEGKTHLYVSFQNDAPKALGDESSRNAVLKEISSRHQNFKFVVLAQDSAFYKQSERYDNEVILTDLFKPNFLKELLGKSDKTGFYFPDDWKHDPAFVRTLTTMQADLLQVLFNGKRELTRNDRLVFIEIFEACLFLHLIVKTNADVVNGTCKDAIDRAMKTLSVFLSIAVIGQDEGTNEELLRIQKTMAHAPAFMVKKQSLIVERRERMLLALRPLQESASVRGRMRDWLQTNQGLFGLIRHAPLAVERRPGQNFRHSIQS